MSESRTLQGSDWHDVVEVLHTMTNTITVRSHYGEGHPAIATADKLASESLGRVLTRIPEIVVALIDGEFVVCERPMPDLRDRIPSLAHAMGRHGIECLVFQNGVTPAECTVLGRSLAQPKEGTTRVRDEAQAHLVHVLLRYAEIREDDKAKTTGHDGAYLVPLARDVLVHAHEALANETPLDLLTIRSVGNRVVALCNARGFRLEPRAYVRGIEDEAIHATNVALASVAMAIDAGYPESTCIELACGALLHDIGHMFLPDEIRGIPSPLLEERALPVFRNHPFAGALVLLGAGCPPLWVSIALEHHRGIDGGGYPVLDGKEAPHELVRMVALASFYDRKRTSIDGKATDVEALLAEIAGLEPRYFGKPLLDRLVRALGVHPPGSTVELSDRQPAVVTRAYANDPWRPQVRPLRGADAGKRIELREMSVVEGRHHRSIVRGIAPPLFRPEDIVEERDEEAIPKPEESWPEAVVADAPRERAPGPTSADIAARELSHMGSMLDDLLSVGEALRSGAGPMAPPPIVQVAPPRPAPPPQPAIPPPSPPQQRATKPEMPIPPPVASPKLAPLVPQVAREVREAPRVPPRVEVSRPPSQFPGPITGVPSMAVPASAIAKLSLDHRAGFVMSLVDGMSDVETIVDASGIPRVEVERILGELVASGVLKMTK